MSNVLNPLPEGFVSAFDTFLQLPPKQTNQLVAIVLESLLARLTPASVESIHKVIRDGGINIELSEMHNTARAIEHVFRVAVAKRTSPDKLSAGLKTFCDPESAAHQALVSQWTDAAPALLGGGALGTPLLPAVKNVEWRLGVTVHPSAEHATEQPDPVPFVGMKLHCVQPSGAHGVEAFQLPLSEFQDFAKEIQNLHSVLSTL